MPVRTRSQRAKELSTSSVSQSARRHTTTSNIGSSGTRTSSRVSKASQEEADTMRNYVQNYLESPAPKYAARQARQDARSTPRVDRFTINDKEQEAMEFLIPPKQKDEPLEIREQIRNALHTSEDSPRRSAFLKAQVPVSPAYPTTFDEETRLWSPECPSFDQEKADRVSRFLLLFILTILTCVALAYWEPEIRNIILPTVRQHLESLAGQVSNTITDAYQRIVSVTKQEEVHENAMLG